MNHFPVLLQRNLHAQCASQACACVLCAKLLRCRCPRTWPARVPGAMQRSMTCSVGRPTSTTHRWHWHKNRTHELEADKSLSQPGCSHSNTIYDVQLQKTIVLRMQPRHRATLTQPLQCDLQRLSCKKYNKTTRNGVENCQWSLHNHNNEPKLPCNAFDVARRHFAAPLTSKNCILPAGLSSNQFKIKPHQFKKKYLSVSA